MSKVEYELSISWVKKIHNYNFFPGQSQLLCQRIEHHPHESWKAAQIQFWSFVQDSSLWRLRLSSQFLWRCSQPKHEILGQRTDPKLHQGYVNKKRLIFFFYKKPMKKRKSYQRSHLWSERRNLFLSELLIVFWKLKKCNNIVIKLLACPIKKNKK